MVNVVGVSATRAGLTVVNAPTGNTSAAVELTFGLLLAVARRTPGFTGADLANVLNEAAHYAFRDQPEAFNRVVATFCRGAEAASALPSAGAQDAQSCSESGK